MRVGSFKKQMGSVLVTSLLTITILTMICATSLYLASQNATSGMQTASWQQSLTAAESGVDRAIRALNNSDWTNWKVVPYSTPAASYTLPTVEPTATATSTAGSEPDSSHYNYFPSSQSTMTMTGEGALNTSYWVTVDQAGMSALQDTNKKQWYRIRSTGQAAIAGPTRSSMNRLDNDLRNTIALKFSRKGGSTLGPTRTIEVIAQPATATIGSRGIVARKTFAVSGNGYIDSFDSSDPFKSNNHMYDVGKRQSHGDVGILDSTGSTLSNGTYIYGNLTYSGPAVQQTQHVQGTISTPFNVNVPEVSAPNWASGSYSTALPVANGGVITIRGDPNASPPTGTASNPLRYQVSSVALSGNNQSVVIQSPTDNTGKPLPGYDNVEIWVTGDLSTSGQAGITQDTNAQVKFYVQGNISLTGNSIVNQSGYAANLLLYGVTPSDGSTHTAYIAGNGNFIGVVDAPDFNTTFGGNGDIMGAVVGYTMTIQGNGSLHYDEALSNVIQTLEPPAYAFASWFEDNSDVVRNIIY